jgi:hypothetical protein
MSRGTSRRTKFFLIAPPVLLALCLIWASLRLGPSTVWHYANGRPLRFLAAVQGLDIALLSDAPPQPVMPAPEKFELSDRTVAAGIVVSADWLSVYDLGPDIGVDGEVLYPGPSLSVPLEEARFDEAQLRGQFVTVLHDHLDTRRQRIRSLLGSDTPNRIVIAADRSVPFSTMRIIMYTAGQAQYSDFQHVVWDEDELIAVASNLPAIGPPCIDTSSLKPIPQGALDALLNNPAQRGEKHDG